MTPNTQELRAIRMAIGARLHERRLVHGVTLHRLSRLTGIGEGKLDQYEMGGRAITLEIVSVIACALGEKMTGILKGDAPRPHASSGDDE